MIFDNLLTDSREIQQLVLDSIEKNESLLLTYFNQHCFNIYKEDKKYQQLLDSKFKVYQADLGVFLAIKFLEDKKSVKKIDATAMNEVIMNELVENKIPLIIVGGKFEPEFVQNQSTKRGINFVGYQHGYFQETQIDEVIKNLIILKNKVYIVGMGVPNQEIFAERLSEISDSKIVICVGSFLEYYFGTKKRTPVFIRKIGLEWMFRIITDPKRMWKRYLIGIPVFVYRVVKIKFTRNKV